MARNTVITCIGFVKWNLLSQELCLKFRSLLVAAAGAQLRRPVVNWRGASQFGQASWARRSSRKLGQVMGGIEGLGHSILRVTERHYSPWVRSRQEQLEADVRGPGSRSYILAEETKGTL